MAMQGSLQDMDVATLIQHNCQDRKTAELNIHHNGNQATLFFKDGDVVHAKLGDMIGEEVVYQIINWNQGKFVLEMGIEPPTSTITRGWSGLLLEAAKRFDEADDPFDDLLELDPEPDESISVSTGRYAHLVRALTQFLSQASEIEGAAIVGTDGLIYAADVPHEGLDENIVGAVTAAIYGLSKRSATQLERGNFSQTFIQGQTGNIIATGLNDDTLFVGLTPQPINLGMAFAEVREITTELRTLL